MTNADGSDVLLTARGGPLHISPEQMGMCALFASGRFVVLVVKKDHNLVRQTKVQARLHGIAVQTELVDDDSAISKIYAGAMPALTESSARDIGFDEQRWIIETINRAHSLGATDGHLDLWDGRPNMTVKYRVDKRVTDIVDVLHAASATHVFNALWTMADNNRGQWQPGKSQMARLLNTPDMRTKGLNSEIVSCRLTFSGFNDGNTLAIRIFTRSLWSDGGCRIEALGFNDHQAIQLEAVRAQPHGVFLIVGETGSGKSTTMKAVLELIDEEAAGAKRIVTVEDPVEFPIRNAIQKSVTYEAGTEDRNQALMTEIIIALRMDPDILMVHEIRDAATASISWQGAQSGHWLGSTLHANGVFEAFTRLDDPAVMGLPQSMIYNHGIIRGIVAQRLMPKLCPHCRVALAERPQGRSEMMNRRYDGMAKRIERMVESFDGIYVRNPEGCPHCRRNAGKTILAGVRGVVLAAEILIPDEQFMRSLRAGAGDQRAARDYLNRQISEGEDAMGLPPARPIMHHAWSKVIGGLIDPLDAEWAVGRFTREGAIDGRW